MSAMSKTVTMTGRDEHVSALLVYTKSNVHPVPGELLQQPVTLSSSVVCRSNAFELFLPSSIPAMKKRQHGRQKPTLKLHVYRLTYFKSNYSHLKGEMFSRYLKPLNLEVHTYGGLVVSFKYVFTKPENSTYKCRFIFFLSIVFSRRDVYNSVSFFYFKLHRLASYWCNPENFVHTK